MKHYLINKTNTFLFLLFCSFSGFSQKVNKTIDTTQITYFYVGDGCPFCNDEHKERKYGFTIKCVGCEVTPEIESNNKITIKKLDKKYGQGWTRNYLKTYCNNASINEKKKQVHFKKE